MDSLSRYYTDIEDKLELPRFKAMQKAISDNPKAFMTMGQVCRDHAENIPDRIALRFEDDIVSYGAFNEGVNRYVHVLRERGVKQGDVVNLMMENSVDFLLAQGACAKVGAIAALINHHVEGDALVHVHQVSGAKIALADHNSTIALAPVANQLGGIEILGDAVDDLDITKCIANFRPLHDELDSASTSEPDLADVSISDVFLYVYTSGTTGLPKPVIIRNLKFSLGGRSLAFTMEETKNDCVYSPTPLYHGWANFVGFSPAFHTGACFSSRRKFSTKEFFNDIRRHNATIFTYVGELCRYLMHMPTSDADRDHSLRLASGAGLRSDIWREFQARFGIEKIIDSYGQTEGNFSLQNHLGRVGSVGRSSPGAHDLLKLVRYDHEKGELMRAEDGFLIECPVGDTGELISCISKQGSLPFDGYADQENNKQKIIENCFDPGDRYIRSGDLLRRDYASYYYFVDRIGDTFRWKGENVATLEVEHLLNGASGIKETAVYGVQVPGYDGRAGMVVVIAEEAGGFDPQDFFDHVCTSLPAYARPLFVRISDAVDITGNFKHRKLQSQKQGFDPSLIDEPLFFRDDKLASYVELDVALYEEIVKGDRRL